MANQSAIIVTRATYNNRKSAGTLLDNVLYIVIEPSVESNTFLSLYLKDNQITDLVSLDDSITISNETDFSNVNIPATMPIKNKLYTITDTINDIIRMYGCLDDYTTVPIYGAPIWE